MIIEGKESKSKAKNILAGAIDIAIAKAERFGTPLVVKHKRKIEKVSPAVMRQQIKKKP